MGKARSNGHGIPPLQLPLVDPGGGSLLGVLHGGAAEQVRLLLQAPAFSDDQQSTFDEAVSGVAGGGELLLRALAFPEGNRRIP